MFGALFFPLHRWKPGEAWNAEGVIECWQGSAGTLGLGPEILPMSNVHSNVIKSSFRVLHDKKDLTTYEYSLPLLTCNQVIHRPA
jgi:hypothetical protein